MTNETQFAVHLLSIVPWSDDALARSNDALYVIVSADGLCKIGRSKSPKSRFRGIQTGNPHQLSLRLIAEGMGWQEPVWHRAFRHLCRGGEWFIWNSEIRGAVLNVEQGDEWIADLIPPEDIMVNRLPRQPDEQFLVNKSPASLLEYRWRSFIADIEEMAAEKASPTPTGAR